MYYDGNSKICPICGNKIIHQYIGNVTSEQLEEEMKCCLWVEVVDEGRSTIGYSIICRGKQKECE